MNPFTLKEAKLIQSLLEERIAWAKRSQEYVKDVWYRATKVEKENKLAELVTAQNLAESALRHLWQVEGMEIGS